MCALIVKITLDIVLILTEENWHNGSKISILYKSAINFILVYILCGLEHTLYANLLTPHLFVIEHINQIDIKAEKLYK